MRCENCGREIDNMWGFCPYCGSFSGRLEDNFMNIARMFGGRAVVRQEGDSYIVILEFQGMRHAFRITSIDVEKVAPSFSSLAPTPQPASAPGPEPASIPRKKRAFERTVEPRTEINYVQDRMYIKVDCPGVAQEDIEIDELESSIEIRAYKDKIRYFKLVPIPEKYCVTSREFLPGEVIIILKKK